MQRRQPLDQALVHYREWTPDAAAYLPADLGAEFTSFFNRRTFRFRHGLGGHPLFTLPNLVELASRLQARGNSYCSKGGVGISNGWSAGLQPDADLADMVSGIHSNDALVMLKGVIDDPLIGPVVRDVLDRIVELAGPLLRDELTAARTTILIASPRRITSYHADADVNFLMQLSGNKLFSVFDQTDRSLVSDGDIERFFAGEQDAIHFLPERQQDAVIHDLRAGSGVHIPSLAPHWARNGDEVSVAVSFNFDLASVEQLASVHRVNYQLRRLGLHPHSPNGHEWRNRIKYSSAQAFHVACDLLHGLPVKSRSSATAVPR